MQQNDRNMRKIQKLARYFLDHEAPESLRSLDARLISLKRQRQLFYDSLPTVMVMERWSTLGRHES